MKFFAKLLLAASVALAFTAANAQVDAQALPGDPKLGVFSYDENSSYRVFTRPEAVTHIQLDKDEQVKLLTLGDNASWITKSFENNVFVKPRYPNVMTSGTLLTNKRTYQFLFRSTTENGRWYQRISFIDPADLFVETLQANRAELQKDVELAPADALVGEKRAGQSVRVEELNSDYDIVGDAEFKPTVVQDDGNFTYIQLRPGKIVPAVFKLNGKDLELVEYTMAGSNLIKIPGILSAGVLKSGKQEVRFYNLRRTTRSLFGEYREIGS